MISLYFLANILSLFVNIILLFVSAYYAKIKVNWYRVLVAALIQCILNHMLHLIDSNDQFMMFITLLSGAACSLVAYIIDSNYIRGICIYTLMHTVIMILSVTFIDNLIINLFAVVFCVVLIKKLSNHYRYDSKNIVEGCNDRTECKDYSCGSKGYCVAECCYLGSDEENDELKKSKKSAGAEYITFDCIYCFHGIS